MAWVGRFVVLVSVASLLTFWLFDENPRRDDPVIVAEPQSTQGQGVGGRDADALATGSRTPLSRPQSRSPSIDPSTPGVDRPGILEDLHATGATPQSDVAIVSHALQAYWSVYQAFPEGDNTEILAALSGENARGITWVGAGEAPTNSVGQLVDRWGSPYYFHRLSGDWMEVRSAGPDLLMWTEDDVSSLDNGHTPPVGNPDSVGE